jgi:hypothetical protein
MFNNSKLLLCGSSSLFFLTSYYGYKIKHPLYSYDLFSAIFSLAYWSNPTNMLLRSSDIMVANTVGLAFFNHGCNNVKDLIKYVGHINTIMFMGCFGMSNYYYMKSNPIWEKYHFCFHLLVGVNKMIVYLF